MSTENTNTGFDFNGCHKHRAEQAARIAGIYSNAEPIFLKAKEEGEKLKAAKKDKTKKEGDQDDDDDDDQETDEGAGDDDDLDDTNDDDEKSKIQKAAWNELGIPYEPTLNKSK